MAHKTTGDNSLNNTLSQVPDPKRQDDIVNYKTHERKKIICNSIYPGAGTIYLPLLAPWRKATTTEEDLRTYMVDPVQLIDIRYKGFDVTITNTIILEVIEIDSSATQTSVHKITVNNNNKTTATINYTLKPGFRYVWKATAISANSRLAMMIDYEFLDEIDAT